MASHKGVVLVSIVSCALLLGCTSDLVVKDEKSCTFSTVMSLRSEWDAGDEACHKKLPFELWTLMKAEGSAQNPDAQYVRANCIQSEEVGLVELITPKGYSMSNSVKAAPGDVVSETEHASTYEGATAATFEAFCEDDDITLVTRVNVVLEAYKPSSRKSRRRLQSTTSEAGQAHQVAELITGLQELGCTRTKGEDQVVCAMSDSFNANGFVASLQATGDLPAVDVVKEIPEGDAASDEGAAMVELMYDIASGAAYKFNTAFSGLQTFADDIGILANDEECDVIVDDVNYFLEPAFRDGVIADAVDAAVDSGSLYFSSAGNSGSGWRFDSNFECTSEFQAFFENGTPACDGTGVASHVFRPDLEETSVYRYLWELSPSDSEEYLFVHWDADIGTVQDILIAIHIQDLATGDISHYAWGDHVSGGDALDYIIFEPFLTAINGDVDTSYKYYLQITHYEAGIDDLGGGFFMYSSSEGIDGKTDGSMYGHACASNCVAVAAMGWDKGGGANGAFEDPETSPVETFSSRGPCIVSGETRRKPTTCAADGLSTSTPGFSEFSGTSAAAPVAAAIATIVRAACFPKVVAYADIMEMLTNYDYTIDYTSDAGGAAETWGSEAGHGIISAKQMLAWVEANCSEACAQTCSDGTEGIDGNGVVCCPTGCNQCGGTGCSTNGAAAGLGASDCCRGDITNSGVYCDATNEAPCIIGSAPGGSTTGGTAQTCSDGTEGIDGNGVVCCPIGCNQCSGNGCDNAGAAAGLGSSDCCGGHIKNSGMYCDDTNTAPCIIGSAPGGTAQTCSDGTEGIDGNGVVCCPIGCNQCSGNGCETSGAAAGLGSRDCCAGHIKNSGVYCDGTNEAPCIIGSAPGGSTPAQTCSDGTEGIDGNGVVCCPIGCNQCGGIGCSTSGADSGLGSRDCCRGDITSSGVYCADTNEAPCIIGSAPGST